MGLEAICTLSFRGKTASGRALLETGELIFRSPDLRLKIPFTDIKKSSADGGALRVTFSAGTAEFRLGNRSSKWAQKIASPKSLLDKLGIKPEHRVCALKLRDPAFMADLKLRAPSVATRLIRDADVIIFGVETAEELARLADLRFNIKSNGMIWTVTPKGKGGVREVDVLAAGKAAGLVDVKVAAFSPTHTASKFVIPKAQR